MKRLVRRPLVIVLAGAAAAALATGIAWAAIPDGNLVNACATEGGPIRAVATSGSCDTGETALQLGGPTRGYSSGRADDVTLGPTSVRVASLVLPAGSYLLHGKVNIANLNFTAIGSTFVPCSIRIAGTTTNIDQTWMIVEQARTGTGASNASIGLQGPVTIPESTGKAEVELLCASLPRTLGPATNVVARYRQLAAVQVDTLQVG